MVNTPPLLPAVARTTGRCARWCWWCWCGCCSTAPAWWLLAGVASTTPTWSYRRTSTKQATLLVRVLYIVVLLHCYVTLLHCGTLVLRSTSTTCCCCRSWWRAALPARVRLYYCSMQNRKQLVCNTRWWHHKIGRLTR